MKKFLTRMLKGTYATTMLVVAYLILHVYNLVESTWEWFLFVNLCLLFVYFVGGMFTDLEDE